MSEPAAEPVGLADLPDDMVRAILDRCSTKTYVRLSCTCRRMRRLASPFPPGKKFTLTYAQHPSVYAWLASPEVAGRLAELVAKRCLQGSNVEWLGSLTALRSLTLAFCRVRHDVLGVLPRTLEHLDLHALMPAHRHHSGRLSFRHLTRLRVLRAVFEPRSWDVAFVCRLPKGLRELRLRGSQALIVESFVPRNLRIVSARAETMLMLCNRLPPTVRSVDLRCGAGCAWLRDTLPVRPRKLEDLSLSFQSVRTIPGLSAMTRLRRLAVHSGAYLLNWRALAALPRLESVEADVDTWLTTTQCIWPSARPIPRVDARVQGVNVTDLVLPVRFV